MRKISQPPDFFKDEIEKLRNDYIDGNTKGEEPPLDWKDLSMSSLFLIHVVNLVISK